MKDLSKKCKQYKFAHLRHICHNDADDKDDCLNPVVAHQHGDDEEDDTKGKGDGGDEVDKLADLERRHVCTKINKS